jgi:hypothetical protein
MQDFIEQRPTGLSISLPTAQFIVNVAECLRSSPVEEISFYVPDFQYPQLKVSITIFKPLGSSEPIVHIHATAANLVDIRLAAFMRYVLNAHKSRRT